MDRRPSQINENSQEEEIFSTNFICQICMNPVSEEKRFRNGKRCSHSFCVDCISYYIKLMVERNKMAQVRCPDLYCDNLLDPLSCSPILPANMFEIWCTLLCELEAFRFPWAYCPSRDCSELILDECGGSARKSSCPKCKTLFCFQCDTPWQEGDRCNEIRRIRDRDGDILLIQLAEMNKWTKCPGCSCFVELIDGCSIVKCRCGTNFCHDCGEKREWNWCGCKYKNMGWREWSLRHLVTFLLIVFCVTTMIWSVRYDVHNETLP